MKAEIADLYMYGAVAILYCGLTLQNDSHIIVKDIVAEYAAPDRADDLLGEEMHKTKLLTALEGGSHLQSILLANNSPNREARQDEYLAMLSIRNTPYTVNAVIFAGLKFRA